MKRPPENKEREDRFVEEVVVDAYGEEERAASPLKVGETVEVTGMADADDCAQELMVLIKWQGEGRVVFDGWRRYYNQERPHRSLGVQTPAQFAKKQCEQGSGFSRATPSFHRNLEWKLNNQQKLRETVSSQLA